MNRCLIYLTSLFIALPTWASECPAPSGFKLNTTNFTWQRHSPDKVRLVNLWAVWCPPCLKELPMLDSIANQASFAVETIHIGDNPTAIDTQFDKLAITHLPQTIEADVATLQQWGFHGLPATMIVVNQQVMYRYSGYIQHSADRLASWLTCLAKENM